MSRGLIAFLALVLLATGPRPAFACVDGCDAGPGLLAEDDCGTETPNDCRDCECRHHGEIATSPAPRVTPLTAPATVAPAAPAPAAPAFASAPDVPTLPGLATGIDSTVLRL